MSVVPSDSVSRQGESCPSSGALGCCPSAPVPPSTDLLPVVGPARFASLLESYNKQMSSYYAAYQTFCRTFGSTCGVRSSSDVSCCNSGVVVGAPSVSSSAGVSSMSSSGVSGTSGPLPVSNRVGKAALRRFTRRMKAKGVASALPGGLCYTRAVRPEARECVALAIGAFPAVGDLLSRPREEFMPLSATETLSMSVSSLGVAHVAYVQAGGASTFNGSVLELAARSEFEYGSYGHYLRQNSSLRSPGSECVSLALDTPVGGWTDRALSSSGSLRVFSMGEDSAPAGAVVPPPVGTECVLLIDDHAEHRVCGLPVGTRVHASYRLDRSRYDSVYVYFLSGLPSGQVGMSSHVHIVDVDCYKAMRVLPVNVQLLGRVGAIGEVRVDCELGAVTDRSELKRIKDACSDQLNEPLAWFSLSGDAPNLSDSSRVVMSLGCFDGLQASVVVRVASAVLESECRLSLGCGVVWSLSDM